MSRIYYFILYPLLLINYLNFKYKNNPLKLLKERGYLRVIRNITFKYSTNPYNCSNKAITFNKIKHSRNLPQYGQNVKLKFLNTTVLLRTTY